MLCINVRCFLLMKVIRERRIYFRHRYYINGIPTMRFCITELFKKSLTSIIFAISCRCITMLYELVFGVNDTSS